MIHGRTRTDALTQIVFSPTKKSHLSDAREEHPKIIKLEGKP